ncbi:solute carrier family 35 member SLC35F1/F2/F6 [Gongronella butleri]|nr:solute carrier family 35 member SLC35F1/F2/F6 [Gongronella butleri]
MISSVTRQWLLPLFLGQVLSLCITGSSTASSTLWQRHQISLPFTQNAFMYGLLAVVYNSYRSVANRKPSPATTRPQKPFYALLFFSFVDVQANIMAVAAFKNTSVLSALIINSWTLPCVMLLSVVLLRARYLRTHYAGATLCMTGLGLLICGDVLSLGDPTSNHTWLGDLLCLLSASLYAVCNVTEEYLVQYYSISHFLSRIGFIGMVQSAMWAWFLEYDTLVHIAWSREIVVWVGVYVLSLFCMYSIMPRIYRLAGATFVSMSLMSSNFYSLLVGLIFLDNQMPTVYPLAYILVVTGAALYNYIQPPVFASAAADASNNNDATRPILQSYHQPSYTASSHSN